MAMDHVSREGRDPARPPFLAQMRRGMLAYCILALLEKRPSCGRELVDSLAEIPGMATTCAAVYPLLGRLTHQRLLAGAFGPTFNSVRRYYGLTDEGRAALEVFERDWVLVCDGLERVAAQRRRTRARTT